MPHRRNNGSEENLGKGPPLDTYKSYHFYKYNKEHNILNEHNIQTMNTPLTSLLKYKKRYKEAT